MFIGNSPKKWIRICPSLNWTINERLTNEELPSFNDCPDVDEDNTDQSKKSPVAVASPQD